MIVALLVFAWWVGGEDGGTQTRWYLAVPVEGTTIRLVVPHFGCDFFDRIEVNEANTSVEIRAFLRTRDYAACIMFPIFERETVHLKQPLGERDLQGCLPPPDEGCIESYPP